MSAVAKVDQVFGGNIQDDTASPLAMINGRPLTKEAMDEMFPSIEKYDDILTLSGVAIKKPKKTKEGENPQTEEKYAFNSQTVTGGYIARHIYGEMKADQNGLIYGDAVFKIRVMTNGDRHVTMDFRVTDATEGRRLIIAQSVHKDGDQKLNLQDHATKQKGFIFLV